VAGADVEVEGLLEEAGRGVEQGTGHGAPQVVDDDVDPAQLVPRRLGQRAHELDVGEIPHDDHGPPTGGLDLRGHLAQLLLGAGGQDDVGAGLGQGHGGGGADAAARSR
jgi:hypothetical protein